MNRSHLQPVPTTPTVGANALRTEMFGDDGSTAAAAHETAADARNRTRAALAAQRAQRLCSRPSCQQAARATLTYRYGTREIMVDALSEQSEPGTHDLCDDCAAKLNPPRGWSYYDSRVRLVADPDRESKIAVLAEALNEPLPVREVTHVAEADAPQDDAPPAPDAPNESAGTDTDGTSTVAAPVRTPPPSRLAVSDLRRDAERRRSSADLVDSIAAALGTTTGTRPAGVAQPEQLTMAPDASDTADAPELAAPDASAAVTDAPPTPSFGPATDW